MKHDSSWYNSIALVTCWYGNYPWYFPYFIHSCSYNPTVDFIIITDNQSVIPNKPQNVKIIHKTLDEFRMTASQKLGFDVNIENPYKLCDFKPAYGFLFPEILKGYDFWGHGDVDVVYGDIRDFMTEEVLGSHDIISSRHDYTAGTFCLFRNNDQVNSLFMLSKDYQKVLSSSEHFCFDECNFLFKPLQKGASIFDFTDNIQSMTWVVKKAEQEGKIKAYFDFIVLEGIPGGIKWEKGKVFYRDLFEGMYYNLNHFKTVCKRPKILNPIPDVFYFTPRKIMTESQIFSRIN